MHLIDKKTKARSGVLSNSYKNALLNSEECDDNQKSQVTEFLNQIKDKYWIECNCNFNKAILVVYSGKYNISVRCKERSSHSKSCIFFVKNIQFTLNKGNQLLPSRKVRMYDLYFKNQEYTSKEAQSIPNDNISNTSN